MFFLRGAPCIWVVFLQQKNRPYIIVTLNINDHYIEVIVGMIRAILGLQTLYEGDK